MPVWTCAGGRGQFEIDGTQKYRGGGGDSGDSAAAWVRKTCDDYDDDATVRISGGRFIPCEMISRPFLASNYILMGPRP